jgi:cytidylate kinase
MNAPRDFMTAEQAALRSVVVAVDGPSGSGKSSVSRGVATRLGLRYLDTGAMYRAVTWRLLQRGVDVDDPAAVAAAAATVVLVSGTDPETPTIEADGMDVSGPIRSPEVTAAVSAVSAVPAVRALLVQRQREAIDGGGIVLEGRDIGTVVAPDAQVKVFLTASAEARAARRTAELTHTSDVEATRVDLARRDRHDSGRAVSPLTKADDAVEVDATRLTLQQVIDRVIELVTTRVGVR